MSETQRPARLAAMLARDEIRQLPYRYCRRDRNARRRRHGRAVLAPGRGSANSATGPDGLRRLMTQSLDGSVFAVILVANHLIDIESHDRARGQVWAHCFAQTARRRLRRAAHQIRRPL